LISIEDVLEIVYLSWMIMSLMMSYDHVTS